MKKWYIALGIAAFWLLIFVVMIAPNQIQVSVPDSYPRVILQTQPVDPRDLLRGDFVILSYDFNRFNRQSWEEPAGTEFEASTKALENKINEAPSGTKIYVVLEVDEQTRSAIAKGITFDKPATGLFLSGTMRGNNNNWRGREARFGIEKYFVPEGKGRELEKARNSERLQAEIAINPTTGKALVVDLLMDETSVNFSEIEAKEVN